MRTSFICAAALLLLSGCGGGDKLTYGDREIEPKSAIFALFPNDPSLGGGGPESVAVVITDHGGFCNEFNGLACLPQPLLAASLSFAVSRPERERFGIGDSARATWRDFNEPRAFEQQATGGSIQLKTVDVDSNIEGALDLVMPDGEVKGDFVANYCQHMRDWFYRCPGAAQ